MTTTDELIERLTAAATPVRRLRAPTWRALAWLAVAALLIAAITAVVGVRPGLLAAFRDPGFALGRAAALATAVTGALATFELSLPDRARSWALLPLPGLVLWIASSGYSCWRHWLTYGPDGWEIGESWNCFRFILAASIPLAASLIFLLRRARPLAPLPCALMGGLGVAAIAAFALQFFHPFDVTFMDLAVHLVAVAIVVAAVGVAERASERRLALPLTNV